MTPDISNAELVVVSFLIVLSIGLAILEHLGLTRDIVVSCIRAFAQLTLVGFVLGAVFDNVRAIWVFLIVAVMIGVAVQAGGSRISGNVPRRHIILAVSIGVASVGTLAFVVVAVVRPATWYDPQIVIPLAGMIVGNTMSGSALALNHFVSDLRNRQDDVEALLGLGATSDQAVADVVRGSIRVSLIPSIAGMMVVGIVALPGMMTGQILAGQQPEQAVRYQIVVQYMLLFAAVLTASLAVRLARRRFFTDAHQLRRELLR